MKTISIIFICLLFGIFIYLFILGIKSQSGNAPGLDNAQLSRCPDTPNCVNSEFPEDVTRYITAIKYSPINKSNTLLLVVLKDVIQTAGGIIERQSENYIAASFTSTIFRFVDDLEIRIDSKQNVIHLRSASRVGRSDLGVNKKRVELIKSLFEIKKINLIENHSQTQIKP